MPRRLLVLLTVLTMTAAACGARLSDEQRAAGINVNAGGGVAADGSTGGIGVAGGGTTGGDGTSAGGATGGGATGGGGGATGGGVTGGGATGGGGGATGGGDTCTPGGSSDTGVTGNKITVATLADVTGPVPGLFKSAHQAVQSYANMVNSHGGICGRGLEVRALDSKSDSGGNRAAVLDACDQAFALVGSMSAFDDGGGEAVDDCGIPDISAITVSPQRLEPEWSYPAFPSRQDLLATGQSEYIKQQYPQAVKKAAILWLNAAVTRNNAAAREAAWEKVGYEFIYKQQVQVLEANYTTFVLEMKDLGVEYVTFVGDNNSIARLLKAADQQSFEPAVFDWDSVAFDPDFLEVAGDAANGSMVFINASLFTEASANPELQRYLEWLERSFPGATPDYFGQYAWSAAALFVEKVRELGSEPTRDDLRTALQNEHSWDGNGLHGPHDTGAKTPSTCFMYMTIQNGGFVRTYPSQPATLDCDLGGLVQV